MVYVNKNSAALCHYRVTQGCVGQALVWVKGVGEGAEGKGEGCRWCPLSNQVTDNPLSYTPPPSPCALSHLILHPLSPLLLSFALFPSLILPLSLFLFSPPPFPPFSSSLTPSPSPAFLPSLSPISYPLPSLPCTLVPLPHLSPYPHPSPFRPPISPFTHLPLLPLLPHSRYPPLLLTTSPSLPHTLSRPTLCPVKTVHCHPGSDPSPKDLPYDPFLTSRGVGAHGGEGRRSEDVEEGGGETDAL